MCFLWLIPAYWYHRKYVSSCSSMVWFLFSFSAFFLLPFSIEHSLQKKEQRNASGACVKTCTLGHSGPHCMCWLGQILIRSWAYWLQLASLHINRVNLRQRVNAKNFPAFKPAMRSSVIHTLWQFGRSTYLCMNWRVPTFVSEFTYIFTWTHT